MIFLAALLIKVDASGDSKENQELLGILLVLVLAAGPIALAIQFTRSTATEAAAVVREAKKAKGVSGTKDDGGGESGNDDAFLEGAFSEEVVPAVSTSTPKSAVALESDLDRVANEMAPSETLLVKDNAPGSSI